MDAVLSAIGLNPEDGLIIIGVTFIGGLIFGIGATTAFSELPLRAGQQASRLRLVLILLVIVGLVAIAFLLSSIAMNGGAMAPVIIFVGLGLLAGPPLLQALEQMPGSRVVGLATLICTEVVVILVAEQHFF